MKTDHPYYVGVHDAQNLRRDLLTSTKDLLESLKGLEEYKAIRRQKLALIIELKKTVDSLVVLNRKLRSAIPRPWMPHHEKAPAVLKPTAALNAKAEVEDHARSKIDMIEHELERIEARLGELH